MNCPRIAQVLPPERPSGNNPFCLSLDHPNPIDHRLYLRVVSDRPRYTPCRFPRGHARRPSSTAPQLSQKSRTSSSLKRRSQRLFWQAPYSSARKSGMHPPRLTGVNFTSTFYLTKILLSEVVMPICRTQFWMLWSIEDPFLLPEGHPSFVLYL